MTEHFQTLARYNRWMNARLYDAAARLSDADRKADRAAFFRSIHGTLNHLLLTDRLWMARFTGATYPVGSLGDELYSDFGELARARVAEDARIERWVADPTDAELTADLEYFSQVNPEPRRHVLWFALDHFFNHQTHHRGQVTTLLYQCGIDPRITDLIGVRK